MINFNKNTHKYLYSLWYGNNYWKSSKHLPDNFFLKYFKLNLKNVLTKNVGISNT